jgi:hypothetical protein
VRFHKRFTILLALVAAMSQQNSAGFLRGQYEDAEVVDRSELIVVGRLQRDSITLISHGDREHPISWWENSAILIVEQVLKGDCNAPSIPIMIHYGLSPAPGGKWRHPSGLENDLGRIRGSNYPENSIEIADTGNSSVGGVLEVDAAQSNLWFLRRLGGEYGRKPDPKADLGILDPEDIQPLKLKDYFLCYLSKEPEPCVRERLQRLPEISSRANRYFTHRGAATNCSDC